MFTDRTGNNSLNSTFINTQEILNGTKNLKQQAIQTPSRFINEEIIKTMRTTTQQSISPIHPTLTTPHSKSTPFPQTAIQSTLKPSVAPKCSQNVTKHIDQLQKHNKQINKKLQQIEKTSVHYHFFLQKQSIKPSCVSNQNQPQEQCYNQQILQQNSQSFFFNDRQRATTDRSESFPFFFFKNIKNISYKLFRRNQSQYSEDEDYFHKNQQNFNNTPQNNS